MQDQKITVADLVKVDEILNSPEQREKDREEINKAANVCDEEWDYMWAELYSDKHNVPYSVVNNSAIGKPVTITLDKSHYVDTIELVREQAYYEFSKKKDDAIRQALIENDIDPNDEEFLKDNLMLVVRPNDNFEHYMIGDKRILSVQRFPTVSQDGNTFNLSCKFY